MSDNKRPILILLGTMGAAPFAGMAWQVLHHLEGFRRAGCDVYYIEDTGTWPYNPRLNAISEDCACAVEFVARTLAWCGMENRWAYRAEPERGRVYGMGEDRLARLLSEADVLVNLTGATPLREEHRAVPIRVYLETDPVAPEIDVAMGRQLMIDLMAAHTHHYTYGENLGAPDCGVPVVGPFRYRPTRPPVILDWWRPAPDAARPAPQFTTIGNWKQSGKDVEWNGQTYAWSKHHEFLKFLDLPRRTGGQSFELALSSIDEPTIALLREHGWGVTPALPLSLELEPYRAFIRGSRGEFTVAKDQNIRLRSGWFSDRTACYLAAGRPVVTQDTGFGNILPTGAGLFPFRTLDDAAAAIAAINADYEGHCRATRRVAEGYFDAEVLLSRMLREIGVIG
jgi:hypothetical protein